VTKKGADAWALVPVKRFAFAKTRLADRLGPVDRIALARAMLCDVLQEIAHTSGIAGSLVVTGDSEAAAIARGFGAQIVDDPAENGTNDAVLLGLRESDAAGAARVVVVPSDLPFVTSLELRAVLSALNRAPVVIVPAARDGGTNILALSPPRVLAPAFGPDSFARHSANAISKGMRPAVLRLQGAAHDIDVPSDLDYVADLSAGFHTRDCLAGLQTALSRAGRS